MYGVVVVLGEGQPKHLHIIWDAVIVAMRNRRFTSRHEIYYIGVFRITCALVHNIPAISIIYTVWGGAVALIRIRIGFV